MWLAVNEALALEIGQAHHDALGVDGGSQG